MTANRGQFPGMYDNFSVGCLRVFRGVYPFHWSRFVEIWRELTFAFAPLPCDPISCTSNPPHLHRSHEFFRVALANRPKVHARLSRARVSWSRVKLLPPMRGILNSQDKFRPRVEPYRPSFNAPCTKVRIAHALVSRAAFSSTRKTSRNTIIDSVPKISASVAHNFS